MADVKFLSKLHTKRNEDGTRDLIDWYRIVVCDELYEIWPTFNTDFSSVPQAFAWIVRWSKIDLAGLVHDFLYRQQFTTRKKADKAWRKIAQHGENKANMAQAWTCWAGLRVGGWIVWNKYAEIKDKKKT